MKHRIVMLISGLFLGFISMGAMKTSCTGPFPVKSSDYVLTYTSGRMDTLYVDFDVPFDDPQEVTQNREITKVNGQPFSREAFPELAKSIKVVGSVEQCSSPPEVSPQGSLPATRDLVDADDLKVRCTVFFPAVMLNFGNFTNACPAFSIKTRAWNKITYEDGTEEEYIFETPSLKFADMTKAPPGLTWTVVPYTPLISGWIPPGNGEPPEPESLPKTTEEPGVEPQPLSGGGCTLIPR